MTKVHKCDRCDAVVQHYRNREHNHVVFHREETEAEYEEQKKMDSVLDYGHNHEEFDLCEACFKLELSRFKS